jgi:hypothetical protein
LSDILENYAQVVEIKAQKARQEDCLAGLATLPPAPIGTPAAWKTLAGTSPASAISSQHSAGQRQGRIRYAWLAHQAHWPPQGYAAVFGLDHRGQRPGASSISRFATPSRQFAQVDATVSSRRALR